MRYSDMPYRVDLILPPVIPLLKCHIIQQFIQERSISRKNFFWVPFSFGVQTVKCLRITCKACHKYRFPDTFPECIGKGWGPGICMLTPQKITMQMACKQCPGEHCHMALWSGSILEVQVDGTVCSVILLSIILQST